MTYRLPVKSVRTLIDTGSSSTIINERLAKELRLPLISLRKGAIKYLFTASGSPLYVVGSCELK